MLDKSTQTGRYSKTERRRKKAYRAAAMPEKALQGLCEQYLNARHIPYIHIPNALYMTLSPSSPIPKWVKRWIKDQIAGRPDLIIFASNGDYTAVLQIELKTETGRLSHRQRDWLKSTGGYVVRDFDTFREMVDKFVDKHSTAVSPRHEKGAGNSGIPEK